MRYPTLSLDERTSRFFFYPTALPIFCFTKMQVESSKLELRQICVEICGMAGTWYHYIKIGRETMSHFSGVRLHILDLENRLTNLSNDRLLRAADREIRTKYDRLSYPIAAMKTYLEQLRKVRDRICTFLSRTRMFMDDEIVEKYDITPILRTPQVLEILEFLRSRYDAEWEVKEMVCRWRTLTAPTKLKF
ncbi:uncharacterized protein LOC117895737 isoform X2 [Drosophila subobscura]|uniref:uncharacterized protein LOC117895737 isoform X2 n=1 Tax=Drosophila subobscura TaxID=7241 RepID=UPI00155A3ABB|nr:uncharacterized protein LOC117895737 isoform X2 [Drosophila subobscura]